MQVAVGVRQPAVGRIEEGGGGVADRQARAREGQPGKEQHARVRVVENRACKRVGVLVGRLLEAKGHKRRSGRRVYMKAQQKHEQRNALTQPRRCFIAFPHYGSFGWVGDTLVELDR